MEQENEGLSWKWLGCKVVSYFTLILNAAFYFILFLIVKNVSFSFSQVTMTSLTSDGSWGIALYFLNKINSTYFLHWLYITTLIIGVWNIVVYKFDKHGNRTPAFLRLRFNIQWLSSPACTSTLYFLIFAIGIYFSIISSAINQWLISDNLMSSGTSFSFSIVVASLALCIIVFILSQIAIGKKKHGEDRANQEVYQDKLGKLEDIIRFAPPNGFANILSNYVDVADDFVQAIIKRSNSVKQATLFAKNVLGVDEETVFKGIDSIEGKLDKVNVLKNKAEITKMINKLKSAQEFNAEYIRAILIAYARLAALFDGIIPSSKNKDIYRANLMLKYNVTDKKLSREDTFRYVPAVLKGAGAPNIKHYLTLHEEHSVKVFSEKTGLIKINEQGEFVPIRFDQDPDIKTFSLPFFLGEDKKNYNCFGAPRAVAEVECQFINNTQKEIKKWRKEQMTPVEIIDEAERHFNQRDIAKSIISLPLMLSRYDVIHKSSRYVMGVVNIYRDKTDLMMGNPKKQEQFEHITTPLNFALSKIVAHDMVHRYHANLLQDILSFATIGSTSIEDSQLSGEIGESNG
ncbi:MAG: hypothetical protein HRT55_14075 [Colwellia sp.]|uniref:hypothetical protein n=1 Tax=Alteromonadales TaxID=135622 RepID=UPI001D449BA8|nr:MULTISPECIES: hypothetical protein [Alteromonadales]NQZ27432.1 hypothetical protein [Colwellia sp.]NRA80339.1 hypothetical protein [Pseudoalteromonas sp.]